MTAQHFKERFLPLHNWLYTFAFKYLGNRCDAEDAVQTLYARLWELRKQLVGIESEKAFCRKILYNICTDMWRKNEQQSSSCLSTDVEDASIIDVVEASDQEKHIARYIDRLPDKQRSVMKMRMVGASNKEIATVTGLSDANVRTILSRVRKQLRDINDKN